MFLHLLALLATGNVAVFAANKYSGGEQLLPKTNVLLMDNIGAAVALDLSGLNKIIAVGATV